MIQLTVKELYEELAKAVREGHGDKILAVADDTEGNSYHGMFYSIITDPDEIKQNIEYSNGLHDSQEKDPTKIAILG